MVNIQAELLQLQIELLKLSDEDEILEYFVTEINRIFPLSKIRIIPELTNNTSREFAIESKETVYGYLEISNSQVTDKDINLIEASCKLTGSLLEKEKLKRLKHQQSENCRQYELLEQIFRQDPISTEIKIKTQSDKENLLLENIGYHLLRKVIGSYLSLLHTSSTVFDNQGNCSLHHLNSDWCKLLYTSSRKNCNSSIDAEAIASGKWLCYESCGNKEANIALREGKSQEIRCEGGLKIITQPVKTSSEIVGCISLAYGTPPQTEEELMSVSRKYNIDIEELIKAAYAYIPRPDFIIEYAKDQLEVAAILLGEIYEKKLTVNKLKETKERWKNLFSKSPYAIAIYEAIENGNDFIFKDLNPAGLKIDKLTSENVIGKRISEVFPGADEHGFLDIFRKVWKTGKEQNHKVAFYKDQRIQGWRENIIYKLNTGEIVAVYNDATGRKENEERLQIQSTALESAANGIVITTISGRIIMINAAFTNLTGYTYEEIKGKSLNILKSGYHKTEFYDNLWHTIHSGKVWKGEIINKRKDGSIYTENMVITPVFSNNNELTHFIAIKEDITGKKIAQEKLRMAKEKAEESDRLKSAFLANISHEIRTPMNGIVGFSEMLIKPNLSRENREKFVNIINKSCRQLTLIIDDIVDVSRIETNQINLNKNKTQIESIMKNLLNFFRPQAKEKNIDLDFTGMGNIPVQEIITDEVKLTQILTNLIGNAIKFTDQGGVTFGCELIGDSLQFYVKDTGIGIKPEYQKIIFERFRQVETSMSRNYGGTGLGLSISKAFVEMMGGKITLDSIPGEGSTFIFMIPFEPVSKPEKSLSSDAKNSTISDFKKHTVLIAEDEAMNYLYLEEVLRETGINLLHAVNGLEAIEFCQNNKQIELILMDIKMPVLNGLDATKEIKSFWPEIPIIAVTAYALDGDKEKILEAGCNDYLSKPVKKADLIEKLKQYLK